MLDINTPKGQESLAQEQRMIDAIEMTFAGYYIVQTPKDKAADVDGFVCQDGEVKAAIENKCRNMTRYDLQLRYNNEWLLTYDKLVRGSHIAKALQVPFVGYLYLVPDNLALYIRLTDRNGALLPNIRLQRSETSASINGGKIIKTNAYVNMKDAKEFVVK